MPQPFRTRGRSDEPWEQGLYFLLLLVAVMVILYSLFGIATLLGYFPLSQKSVGSPQVLHPALADSASIDRVKDGALLSENVGRVPCARRAGMPAPPSVRASAAPDSRFADCEAEGYAARNATVPTVPKRAEAVSAKALEAPHR